jgi:hypothetical protein
LRYQAFPDPRRNSFLSPYLSGPLFPLLESEGSFCGFDDNDDTPIGAGTTGDGLSYWEEARGFRMQGKTSPTNPRKKDLFVFNPDKL